MKKLTVLFGVLMIISSVAFAGEVKAPKAASTSVSLNGEIVKIFYQSENSERVKVTIYNADKKAVFSEQIKNKSSFIRPYNLENLPYGEYTIVLEDKDGRSEEKITYGKKDADAFASIISHKNGRKAMVALFSKGETEITYNVLDSDSRVLYSQTETINGQAAKAFNLEKVKGAVTILVSGSNGVLDNKTL